MEGLRISHYRILRRLGSGGMGEVRVYWSMARNEDATALLEKSVV